MPFTLLEQEELEWEALAEDVKEYSADVDKAIKEGVDNVAGFVGGTVSKIAEAIIIYILEIISVAAGDIGAMFGYVMAGYEEGGQRARRANPVTLMTQGDLLELFRRRVLDTDYFTDQLARTGLDTEAINNLKNLIRSLLNPPDIATSYYRGTSSDTDAVDGLIKLGYTEDDARILIDNGAQLIDVERTLDAMLRGEIDDTETNNRLRSLGYKPESIELLKRLALYIPPVEDLITMSVREVFSPEIAEKFGQYEDFPTEFERFARMKGVSTEWAQRYWAAHWRLPSAEMGYEMLHRDVIGQDDLNMLLRALDIMPYWRDKMIEISYRPYTRVDVRRMHKYGVLEVEDLVRAYKDIGYNDERAEKMAEFTEAYNLGEEKTLHKGELTRLYTEHVIKRDDYIKQLIGLGINKKSANYLADLADIKIEKKVLDEQIRSIGILYMEGRLAEDQAQVELNKLDLSTAQILRYFEIWNAKKASKFRHLPLEKLDKLLKLGLIKQDDYLTRVQTLGYSNEDARLLMALAVAKESKGAAKPTE